MSLDDAIEPAAARIDYRSFMISFVTAIVIILPLGTLDVVRVLNDRKAH